MNAKAQATHLVDGNVLVALADTEHVHHLPARRWFVAHLAALARRNGGRLATFDRGLAALHVDVAVLIEE